jgi:acetate kinase
MASPQQGPILVINAGSSSVKFTLFEMPGTARLATGIVERIGTEGTRLHYTARGRKPEVREAAITDVHGAVVAMTTLLTDQCYGVIASSAEIAAVGHRVVHGGEKISVPVVIDARIKGIIQECYDLAPLHNPPNMRGIEACEEQFPGVAQVAVFDTAFHAAMPPQAFLYGLPHSFYTQDKIRRYGFHGSSHKYVCTQAARYLKRPLNKLRLISCHLGNGCSIAAVKGGQSIDTSMGLTPLEGLIMGTRCGDIDPAIVFHVMTHKQIGPQALYQVLNRESGLWGLAGVGSSDVRDILAAAQAGNARARTALEVFAYRVRKYIGAYTAVLGRVDAIIFTAGIGENAPLIREWALEGMDDDGGVGVQLDRRKNEHPCDGIREIQAAGTRPHVLVIPTDEAKEIALQTLGVLERGER